MTILQAIILSLVEGFTEFLPISSTGHLILTSTLLRISQTAFTSTFEIFIQLGAIIAISMLYGVTAFKDISTRKNLFYAFIPTAIVGFILYKFIKHYLLQNPWVVVISLCIGGLILLGIELLIKPKILAGKSITDLTPQQSILIGLFQSLSVIPGVSRAAATIIGGQIVGLSRSAAVEFSFLLALPTMTAATALDLIKTDMHTFGSTEFLLMGIGSIVSCITAYIVAKLFLKYIQHHSFIVFGIYRILAAILFTFFVLR